MTTPTQTRAIAADRLVGIGRGTGAPTRRPEGHQAVNRSALTCTWATTDDGSLVMRWTEQTPRVGREEMTKAAA